MESQFRDYGDAVCSHIRYATRREKRDIRNELATHLEDHTEALLEEGLSLPEAIASAVESMGSPDEVGEALNWEYPLRWLALARLSLVLLLAAGLLLLCLLPTTVSGIAGNWEARFHPMSGFASYLPPNPDGVLPLNIREELPNDIVLVFRQTVLEGNQGYICVALFGKNPLLKLTGMSYPLSFTRKDSPRQEPLSTLVSGEAWQSAIFCVFCVNNIEPGTVLLAHMDRFGQSYQWEIPLPGEAEP